MCETVLGRLFEWRVRWPATGTHCGGSPSWCHHLPLGVDTTIGQGIVGAVASRLPAANNVLLPDGIYTDYELKHGIHPGDMETSIIPKRVGTHRLCCGTVGRPVERNRAGTDRLARRQTGLVITLAIVHNPVMEFVRPNLAR